MKIQFLIVLLAAALRVHAVIPEPDNLIYGSIQIGGVPVTAANKNVYVEARRSASGAVVAKYQMGSDPARGDLFCLEVKLESFAPVMASAASESGQNLIIVVRDQSGIRDSREYTLGLRGLVTRMDFGGGSDDNGIPDSWETTYFPNPGQDPNGDPDHDGTPNIEEYYNDTNPTVPDTRHPADIDPANNYMTINEATAYGLAWKTGQPWSVKPTNIPIDFVTRAGTLWKGGEFYKMDLNVSATAPLWWVNATPPTAPSELAAGREKKSKDTNALAASTVAISSVTRSIIRDGSTLKVVLNVIPAEGVEAWAIEETLPTGAVAANITESGTAVGETLRWGPFFDASAKTLSFTIASTNSAHFSGVGSFDGNSVEIAGQSSDQPPASLAATFKNGGGVELILTGVPGVEYRLEASEDLTAWTEIGRYTPDQNGAIRIAETAASGNRFFRAIAE